VDLGVRLRRPDAERSDAVGLDGSVARVARPSTDDVRCFLFLFVAVDEVAGLQESKFTVFVTISDVANFLSTLVTKSLRFRYRPLSQIVKTEAAAQIQAGA